MGRRRDSLEIRVVLTGSQVTRFQRVQEAVGINSRADVLRHLITSYPLARPRFEHLNTYHDHVTIQDHALDQRVDVEVRATGAAFCTLCRLEACPHIDYVRSLPLARVQPK